VSWLRRTTPPVPPAEERLEAAKEAAAEAEGLREKAQGQVSFLQGLRGRWERIHEENHLAELFREEWRRT
jgi:hypothetical protein